LVHPFGNFGKKKGKKTNSTIVGPTRPEGKGTTFWWGKRKGLNPPRTGCGWPPGGRGPTTQPPIKPKAKDPALGGDLGNRPGSSLAVSQREKKGKIKAKPLE